MNNCSVINLSVLSVYLVFVQEALNECLWKFTGNNIVNLYIMDMIMTLRPRQFIKTLTNE